MAPSIRSLSSKSHGAPSLTNWRTPGASPLSSSHPTPASYHQTAILRSPIAPYMPSPLIRPTLCPSPGQSVLNSPAAGFSSPSPHRVCLNSQSKQYFTLNMMKSPRPFIADVFNDVFCRFQGNRMRN